MQQVENNRTEKPVFLFDMDGTLIDASPAIYNSAIVALKTAGIGDPGRAVIESQIGLPLPDMFRALHVRENDIESAVESYRQEFRRSGRSGTTLLPGALEACKMASENGRTAVVTTKTGWYTRELIVSLGIGDYLETVVGYEDVKNPKPHPEPVYLAVEKLGLPSIADKPAVDHIWMIGDTKYDLGAAINAGVRCAIVPGFGKLKDLPDGVVSGGNVYDVVNRILHEDRIISRQTDPLHA